MKDNIGSHYSNDDKRLYEFSRKAEPPWYPEPRFGPDGIVMLICFILAIAALFSVWYTEGKL